MRDEPVAQEVPRDESPTLTLAQHRVGTSPPTPDVRLYHRAVVAPMEPPLRWGLASAEGWLAGAVLALQRDGLLVQRSHAKSCSEGLV